MFDKASVIRILGNHFQKYEYSCFPSAIEIALKLEASRNNTRLQQAIQGLSLQDQYLNCFSEGCFLRDYGNGIGGMVIQKSTTLPPSSFHKDRILKAIDDELNDNKVIIIETGWLSDGVLRIHAHVAYKWDALESVKTYWLVTGSFQNPVPLEYNELSASGLFDAMRICGKLCYWTYDL